MHFRLNHDLPGGVITKTFRFFKLFVAFILAGVQLSAKSYSQKLTLHEKNATIQEIFHDIWKQNGVQFVYTNEVLKGARPITISVRQAGLTEVLAVCFKDQPFTYQITNKAIIVKRRTLSDKKTEGKITVKGYVTDSLGKPIAGVSVEVKGTKTGTTTGEQGQYILSNVPERASLVFSYVGMQTLEVEVNSQINISVILKVQPSDLDQIVVIGYGTQKKEFLTAAISTVSGEELVKAPVPNISTALKGQLAGLVALQNSGKPGADGAKLTIRGIGTYTGQTGPLIMVDGIARDTYDDIDPNEVASISILKDASATAVYGVRGANGVILITTKRGKIGAPQISLSGQTAITKFTNIPRFVNSYEYASLLNEQSFETYWINHANDADIKTWDDFVRKRNRNWKQEANIYYSDEDLKYYKNAHTPKLADGRTNPYYDPYFHPDVDWVDQIFKKFTQMSQANANIKGGTKFLRYFVSLGYLNQGGLFKTDYLTFPDEMEFRKNRYNLRGNFDFDVTEDFKVSVNLAAQFVKISGMDNDQYTWEKRILWSTPLASPGMIDGKYVVPFNNQNDQLNPMYAIENSNNYNITNNSILNSSVVFQYQLDKLTKGLSVKGLGSYDSYFSSAAGGNYRPLWYGVRENPNGDRLDPILVQLNDPTPPSRWGDYFNGKWRKLYGEVSIHYDRTFGDHAISALALGSKEKKHDPGLQYDLPHAYESLAGRIHYAYANKYIAEFDMGYNGSENFPEGKRFGFFPSYSAGWIVSNESFYPKNDWISFLKFRASYGKVGNDNIGGARYLYLPDTWKYEGGYNFGDLDNRNYIQGADENVLGNPDVTWEVSQDLDLAVEVHLFKNKLSLIYDYFKNKRTGILSYRQTIPDIVQANLPPYNLGSVNSWGHDLEIKFNDKIGDFSYYVRGNGAIHKNKIIFQDEPILKGQEYQAATGRPVGQQLLLMADGLYTSWADLYAIDDNGNPVLSQPVLALKDGQPYKNANGDPVFQKDLGYAGVPLQPGSIRLEDVNGDGLVDDKDRVRTGKTVDPIYNFGLTVGFNYKGFDVSALFAGVAGVARGGMSELHFNKQQSLFGVDANRFTLERYNNGERIHFPMAAYNQQAAGSGAGYAGNTFFLIDASYVRLQNLVIGYTFNKRFLHKMGIRSTRLFLSGDNLYTWAPNKIWGDPENLGNIGYPLTKTFNVGVNINF